MFNNSRLLRHGSATALLLACTITAIAQQMPQLAPIPPSPPAPAITPAPAPTRQMIKVMRTLSRFDEGAQLDIRLAGGSHLVGTIRETRSSSFVLADSVTGRLSTIDYVDVEAVRQTGKGAAARQLHKAANRLASPTAGLVIVAGVLGVIAILVFRK